MTETNRRRRRVAQTAADPQKVHVDRLFHRPREIAEMLGMSRSKVYEMIATGQLPGVSVAGCTRVSVDVFRAWVAAARKCGPANPQKDPAP